MKGSLLGESCLLDFSDVLPSELVATGFEICKEPFEPWQVSAQCASWERLDAVAPHGDFKDRKANGPRAPLGVEQSVEDLGVPFPAVRGVTASLSNDSKLETKACVSAIAAVVVKQLRSLDPPAPCTRGDAFRFDFTWSCSRCSIGTVFECGASVPDERACVFALIVVFVVRSCSCCSLVFLFVVVFLLPSHSSFLCGRSPLSLSLSRSLVMFSPDSSPLAVLSPERAPETEGDRKVQ